MKNLLIKQSLVVLLLVTGLFASSQEVQFKYNFVKGKSYVISNEVNNNVTQSMGGQEMKVETGISMTTDMTIENVDKNNNATILFSIKTSSIHTKIPMMNRDTTMNFNGLNEQKREVISEIGKKISEESISQDKKMMMMGSAENFIKLPELPNKLVKVGEKWNTKMADTTKMSEQNPLGTNVLTEMEYTFVGKESKEGKELLKVSFTGSLTINGKGNQMGMDLFVEGTGKTEGFAYFDSKTLMVVYNEANTEMDMTIAVAGQQNMTMPMTQSMKVITKIEEKK